MRLRRLPNLTFQPTCKTARLFHGLLVAALAVPLAAISVSAQSAPQAHAALGFGPVYDYEHEITLVGNIHEVVTKRVAGSPVGMHLMVEGSKGLVDAHVGPFLSAEVKEALHAGAPVQLVGAMTELHDKQYLMVRELGVGGRTVTIRSKRGFLVYPHVDRVVGTNAEDKSAPKFEGDGGVR